MTDYNTNEKHIEMHDPEDESDILHSIPINPCLKYQESDSKESLCCIMYRMSNSVDR